MKKYHFPYVALIVGSMLMMIIHKGSEVDVAGVTRIPLLTLLAISEVAFFATAMAVYIGIKHTLSAGVKVFYIISTIYCALLSIRFMWLGIELWPL